jgi:glycosyltransferase involved in cell wall biosynthesis
MRILMLSLDRKILDADSPVAKRIAALSHAVGEITVLTPEVGNKVLAFFRLWRKANKLLNYNKQPTTYNLITVQGTTYLALLAYLLAKKSRLPFEVQVHGFERMFGIRVVITRFVLQKATKVRVVSERLRTELTTRYTLHATRLYVLPVYTQISAPERHTKRRSLPVPFTFLTIGRLVPVKNIGLQIDALAKLSEKIPHVRLRIVGDGPLLESLKFKAESLKLGDKVSFEGFQKDVSRYYSEADAFLFTSDSEGWGRVALEAAAYRLPIVMTNVGLANEVLHHDKEAIVVPVGDTEQLYLAMKDIVGHPELRERLGRAAFAAFVRLPAPEEQIRKQVEAWQDIAEL